MKTNPWLLVLDFCLNMKQYLQNKTYAIQVIYSSRLLNIVSDKQLVVSSIQSVVSVSRRRKAIPILEIREI